MQMFYISSSTRQHATRKKMLLSAAAVFLASLVHSVIAEQHHTYVHALCAHATARLHGCVFMRARAVHVTHTQTRHSKTTRRAVFLAFLVHVVTAKQRWTYAHAHTSLPTQWRVRTVVCSCVRIVRVFWT